MRSPISNTERKKIQFKGSIMGKGGKKGVVYGKVGENWGKTMISLFDGIVVSLKKCASTRASGEEKAFYFREVALERGG